MDMESMVEGGEEGASSSPQDIVDAAFVVRDRASAVIQRLIAETTSRASSSTSSSSSSSSSAAAAVAAAAASSVAPPLPLRAKLYIVFTHDGTVPEGLKRPPWLAAVLPSHARAQQYVAGLKPVGLDVWRGDAEALDLLLMKRVPQHLIHERLPGVVIIERINLVTGTTECLRVQQRFRCIPGAPRMRSVSWTCMSPLKRVDPRTRMDWVCPDDFFPRALLEDWGVRVPTGRNTNDLVNMGLFCTPTAGGGSRHVLHALGQLALSDGSAIHDSPPRALPVEEVASLFYALQRACTEPRFDLYSPLLSLALWERGTVRIALARRAAPLTVTPAPSAAAFAIGVTAVYDPRNPLGSCSGDVLVLLKDPSEGLETVAPLPPACVLLDGSVRTLNLNNLLAFVTGGEVRGSPVEDIAGKVIVKRAGDGSGKGAWLSVDPAAPFTELCLGAMTFPLLDSGLAAANPHRAGNQLGFNVSGGGAITVMSPTDADLRAVLRARQEAALARHDLDPRQHSAGSSSAWAAERAARVQEHVLATAALEAGFAGRTDEGKRAALAAEQNAALARHDLDPRQHSAGSSIAWAAERAARVRQHVLATATLEADLKSANAGKSGGGASAAAASFAPALLRPRAPPP